MAWDDEKLTWSHETLPDSALDPESLVGRVLASQDVQPEAVEHAIAFAEEHDGGLRTLATIEKAEIPLWRTMHVSYWVESGTEVDEKWPPAWPRCYAAEIEAIRDYITPDSDSPSGEDWPDAYYRLRYAKWERDQEIRALLTEQARIAREGN